MARESKKVIWAVNPFSEPGLGKPALRVLKNLSKKGYASIQPVFVYSPMILDTPLRVPTAAAEKFRALAQKALDRRVHGSGIRGIRPLKLITENFMTVREQAAELVRFAHENRFSLVVVSTRARKGLQRWMLGSFAETLMLHSDVPLLLVNPSATGALDFKNIVFPTDFSRESRLSFQEAVLFARGFKARIVLYHRIRSEGMPLFDIAFGGGGPVGRDRLMEARSAYLVKANRWAELAREAGVPVQVVIDTKPGSPSDGILAQARKTPGMIALAARGGPFHAAFLGSTARNVVRASVYPVWVIHPSKRGRLAKLAAGVTGKKNGRDLFTLTEADILHDLPHIPRKRSA